MRNADGGARRYYDDLVAAHGEDRAHHVLSHGTGHVAIFPNLVIIASQLRVIRPISVAETEMFLYPTLLHLPRAFWRAGSVVPLGLLPPSLRSRYGFAWGAGHARAFRLARAALRRGLPLLPDAVRIMPRARRAERERSQRASDPEFARRARSPS